MLRLFEAQKPVFQLSFPPKLSHDLFIDQSYEIIRDFPLSQISVSNCLFFISISSVACSGVQTDLSILSRLGGQASDLPFPELTL